MARFCVNKNVQTNGDHEVHNLTTGCTYMPSSWNQQDLGEHSNCHGAVTLARAYYSQSNGCAFCCPACHTG